MSEILFQDLIEMLNRNQSLSNPRWEEQGLTDERRHEDERRYEEERLQQQRKAEEIEKLERERKEELRRKQEEILQAMREEEIERKNREERERKNREERETRNREERETRNREESERMERNAEVQHQQDIQTKIALLDDAFPLSSPPPIGKDLRQPERSTDQGSSLRSSSHPGSLNYETETGGSSSSTALRTDTFHGKAGASKSFGKQETVDEVQDIEEDIEVEQAWDSDDQFNF